MNQVVCIIFLSFLPFLSTAQDPFFAHFYNNESAYNPALTGYRGALSLSAKYKSQWAAAGVPAFRTLLVSLEESLPCTIFDYGFSVLSDQEGDGIFRTLDIGGKLAGVVPFDWGNSRHNLRFGMSLQWSVKSIDYSRLIFSDQLDPKYGFVDVFDNPIPTGFVPPNDGKSLWFFTPSVGFSHRILVDESKRRSPTIHYGLAVHNAYSLGKGEYTGQEESLLNIGTLIPRRYSFFGAAEFIPYLDRAGFIAVKPQMFYQRQAGLSYIEAGGKFSLNRFLALNLLYHFNQAPPEGRNSNWFSIALELGWFMSDDTKVDLGFAYSGNISGLRNQVGPIFEVSMAFHFNTSPGCKLAGSDIDKQHEPNFSYRCPTSSQTPWRRKLYEGIWYRTIH